MIQLAVLLSETQPKKTIVSCCYISTTVHSVPSPPVVVVASTAASILNQSHNLATKQLGVDTKSNVPTTTV
jgi:hypothetical protein